jgi:hypothetical protein
MSSRVSTRSGSSSRNASSTSSRISSLIDKRASSYEAPTALRS